MNTTLQRIFTACLSAIYLAALIAIILFKFPFKGDDFGSIRAVVLVPFYVDEIKNVSFFRINLVYNILFFIPVGTFTCLLKQDWRFAKRIISIALLSVTFEVLQFILGIGISDVTDLITNTAGGIVGILFYCLAHKVFKEKTQIVINLAALGLTIVMAVLFGTMFHFMIR